MSAAHLRQLALVSLALLPTAACSGNLSSLEELSRGADASGGVFFSEEELTSAIAEAQPVPQSEDGPISDSIAADAIAAELQAAGIDMTGIRVSVWPLTGDGRTFLVLNLTEETPLISGAEQGAGDAFEDALFSTLVNGRAAREAGVARFAFRFTGQVEQDPVEVVFAVTMEDIEESLRTGADPFERALVQITGGPNA
ncbi:MAG: hypothetical protein ACRDH9_12965 [Actinomycetota bacterium]